MLRAARSSAGRQPLCPSWSTPGKPGPHEPPDDDSHQHRLCLRSAALCLPPSCCERGGRAAVCKPKPFSAPRPQQGPKSHTSIPPECNTAFLLPPPPTMGKGHVLSQGSQHPALPGGSSWGGFGFEPAARCPLHPTRPHRTVHGQCSPSL